MRHDRFPMRSWLGKEFFVLLYSLHIWIPSGSFFCSSSGVSTSTRLAVEASSRHGENNDGRSTLMRAPSAVGERSSLVSRVVAEVSEEAPDELFGRR